MPAFLASSLPSRARGASSQPMREEDNQTPTMKRKQG